MQYNPRDMVINRTSAKLSNEEVVKPIDSHTQCWFKCFSHCSPREVNVDMRFAIRSARPLSIIFCTLLYCNDSWILFFFWHDEQTRDIQDQSLHIPVQRLQLLCLDLAWRCHTSYIYRMNMEMLAMRYHEQLWGLRILNSRTQTRSIPWWSRNARS